MASVDFKLLHEHKWVQTGISVTGNTLKCYCCQSHCCLALGVEVHVVSLQIMSESSISLKLETFLGAQVTEVSLLKKSSY